MIQETSLSWENLLSNSLFPKMFAPRRYFSLMIVKCPQRLTTAELIPSSWLIDSFIQAVNIITSITSLSLQATGTLLFSLWKNFLQFHLKAQENWKEKSLQHRHHQVGNRYVSTYTQQVLIDYRQAQVFCTQFNIWLLLMNIFIVSVRYIQQIYLEKKSPLSVIYI